jgi:hypothetical protein
MAAAEGLKEGNARRFKVGRPHCSAQSMNDEDALIDS